MAIRKPSGVYCSNCQGHMFYDGYGATGFTFEQRAKDGIYCHKCWSRMEKKLAEKVSAIEARRKKALKKSRDEKCLCAKTCVCNRSKWRKKMTEKKIGKRKVKVTSWVDMQKDETIQQQDGEQ